MSTRAPRHKQWARAWRKSVVRKRVSKVVRWPFQALALALFWALVALLPLERASALGRAMMRTFGPWLPWHGTLRRNLAVALAGADPQEIERLTRDSWGNLGATLAEYPHLETIVGRHRRDRVELVMSHSYRAHHGSGRPAVFVTGHLGNWEVGAAAGMLAGIPLTVVYSRQSNPLCEWMLQRRRRVLGCSFHASDAGVRELVSELKQGRSIALLVDVRVDNGEALPFFGHPAGTTLIPARLAMRYDCPLVPVRVERLGGVRFRITIGEPIWPDAEAPNPDLAASGMMRQVNAVLEGWIRERPGEWQCLKRRFPRRLGDGRPASMGKVAA